VLCPQESPARRLDYFCVFVNAIVIAQMLLVFVITLIENQFRDWCAQPLHAGVSRSTLCCRQCWANRANGCLCCAAGL
jgi:hypothetical protein